MVDKLAGKFSVFTLKQTVSGYVFFIHVYVIHMGENPVKDIFRPGLSSMPLQPVSSCCAQVDKIKSNRVIPADHPHQISSTEQLAQDSEWLVTQVLGVNAQMELCVGLSLCEGMQQIHYVLTWGCVALCVCVVVCVWLVVS